MNQNMVVYCCPQKFDHVSTEKPLASGKSPSDPWLTGQTFSEVVVIQACDMT